MKRIKYLGSWVPFVLIPVVVTAGGIRRKDAEKVVSIEKIANSSYKIKFVIGVPDEKEKMEFLIPAKCHHVIRDKVAETFCCTTDESMETVVTFYSGDKKEIKKGQTENESYNFNRIVSDKGKPFERQSYYPELCTWTDSQLLEHVKKLLKK